MSPWALLWDILGWALVGAVTLFLLIVAGALGAEAFKAIRRRKDD